MRKYYKIYTQENYTNVYDLVYVKTAFDEIQLLNQYDNMDKNGNSNCVKLTRAQAINNCIQEKKRRKDDPEFSGFAPITIRPHSCLYCRESLPSNPHFILKNYIWEEI